MKRRRIVVFSGGSAFRDCARLMVERDMDAVHFLPGFDSGGSSAVLRDAFSMPAVGDLRSRHIAMAPPAHKVALMERRLSDDDSVAGREFDLLCRGRSVDYEGCKSPFIGRIATLFAGLLRKSPRGLDCRKACVGNLVLTALYLEAGRNMSVASRAFAQLIGSKGEAFLSSDTPAHLYARLGDGTVLLGQHAFTGKECLPIRSKVVSLGLCRSLSDTSPVSVVANRGTMAAVSSARIVVFPVGSFYSSIVSHLLLEGIPKALGNNPCPKLFIPNAMSDPELIGCPLWEQVDFLLARGAVTHLLVDPSSDYPGGIPSESVCRRQGITLMKRELNASDGHVRADRVVEILQELA